MTSVSRTGAAHWRGGSMPASTSSDSALRRMRVARWSRRNRLASASASVSLLSSSVMKSSWRPSRFWLRRPRLTKLSAMLRRSTACSTARSSAVSCTVLSASATSDTSSRVSTRTARTWGTAMSSPSGVSRMSIDGVGQAAVGHLLGLAGQRAQRLGDRARHQPRQHDGGGQGGDGQRDVEALARGGLVVQLVGPGVQGPDQFVAQPHVAAVGAARSSGASNGVELDLARRAMAASICAVEALGQSRSGRWRRPPRRTAGRRRAAPRWPRRTPSLSVEIEAISSASSSPSPRVMSSDRAAGPGRTAVSTCLLVVLDERGRLRAARRRRPPGPPGCWRRGRGGSARRTRGTPRRRTRGWPGRGARCWRRWRCGGRSGRPGWPERGLVGVAARSRSRRRACPGTRRWPGRSRRRVSS